MKKAYLYFSILVIVVLLSAFFSASVVGPQGSLQPKLPTATPTASPPIGAPLNPTMEPPEISRFLYDFHIKFTSWDE